MEVPMPDKPWLPTPWGGRELDPFFRGFRTQLDSLFEDWFGRSTGGTLAPRVDVSETGKEVTLKVELPGVEEKDIDVSLSGNQLTIKGGRRNPSTRRGRTATAASACCTASSARSAPSSAP
jgi:HSP20 family protein